MVIIDAVVRLIPGVLGDEPSIDESFYDGLLEYPQYTRPANFRGMEVPSVLLSGDHGKVDAWRRQQSLIRTARLRPILLESANVSQAEQAFAIIGDGAIEKRLNQTAPFYLRGCTFTVGLMASMAQAQITGLREALLVVVVLVFVMVWCGYSKTWWLYPYTIPLGLYGRHH